MAIDEVLGTDRFSVRCAALFVVVAIQLEPAS